MKRLLIALALTSTAFIAPASAADVGVSVSIGQPGFYGRVDIGGYPQPQVIYRQPRVIERVEVEREPIYLHVPPGHAKHWSRHCGEYNACGERVYFVQDAWYNNEYAPRYQEQHREHGDARNEDRRDDRRDEHRDDHREDHRSDNHRNDRDHEH